MLKSLLLNLFLLLFCCQISFGQETFAINISKQSGIPNVTVYDFIQDSKGFIWITTNVGISRYDGFEFVSYNAQEQTSLAGSSIFEDKYGRIWYENFDGYLYYVKNEQLFALKQNRPGEYLPFGIVDNYIFVSQQKGIDVYDLKTLKLIKSIEIDAKNPVSSRVFQKAYYFLAENTLYRIDKNLELKKSTYFNDNGFNVNMMCDNGQQLFMIYKNSDQHRLHFVNSDLKYDRAVDLPTSTSVMSMQFLDNKYWLFSNQGAFVYDENFKFINSHADLGLDVSVNKCIIDRSGNHWFSSLRNGLYIISDFKNKVYNLNNMELAFLVKKKNSYMVGSYQSQIYETDLNFNLKSELVNHGAQNFIMNLFYDEENDLIFNTTTKGLFIFHGKKKVYFEDIAVKRILKLDHKYYAVTTSGFVLLIKNPIVKEDAPPSKWDDLYNKNFPSTTKNGAALLSNLRAKSLCFYGDDSKFIVSSNIGLYVFDPTGYKELLIEGKSFYGSDLFYYNKKLYLLDNNGNFVVVYRSGNVSFLNNELGIPPNSIRYIKRFGDVLYLACANRIFEYDLAVSSSLIYSYNTNLLVVNDLIRTYNELILLAGTKLVTIGLNRKRLEYSNPEFYFNNCFVNTESISKDKLQNLKSSENSIRFTYSLLDYASSKEPRMSYRLNKGEWIALTAGSREIQLVSLSPGKYKLEVQMNNYILDQSINFQIQYPFYFQWWFILSVFVVIVSLIAMSYYIRMRSLRKKIQLLNEKIILENKLKVSMLTSIKAQMNPHFFYNALNTIQSYIFSNDKFNATTYLAKFSKLTRMILEMSGQETIKLEDEIASLKLYLELEKMRFQSDFEFEIVVDKQMDVQSLSIPSMLIQPYVENAVKHGLLHKEGAKTLAIHFYDHEDFVVVVIEDNGVGREKSAKINQQKFDKPKSFSTESNKTRLDILNHDKDVVSVRYEDKMSSNYVPLGTKVTLNISKKWQ